MLGTDGANGKSVRAAGVKTGEDLAFVALKGEPRSSRDPKGTGSCAK